MGQIHARALGPGGLAESELVAVCDESGDRARAFAARYGAQAFEDPGAMLAQARVEAVSVCTPHPAPPPARGPGRPGRRACAGGEAHGREPGRLRRHDRRRAGG